MLCESTKTTIFPDLESIAAPYAAILLDAYGVFWGGNGVGLLPGCKETMERLVASKKIVGILSNTTQFGQNEIEKLKAHDLIQGKHFHFLITSGDVTVQVFSKGDLPFPIPNRKFFLFGDPHPKFSSPSTLFKETSFQETSHLEEADFIYISIPHKEGKDQTDPLAFKEKVAVYKTVKIPMVCTNPDCFAHEGKPPQLVVRQGSIAQMHEEQGGQVFYIGKPSEKMFTAAMRSFNAHGITDPQQILMVGDTPETDIRGARNYGIPAALIIQTGIMAERIASQGFEKAIETLSEKDKPDFFINRMGGQDGL